MTLESAGTNSAMATSNEFTMLTSASAREMYDPIAAVEVAPSCAMMNPKRASLGTDSVAATSIRCTAKLHGLKNLLPGAVRQWGRGGQHVLRRCRVCARWGGC